MDKQFLKEHNLTEAQKRFQRILEFTSPNFSLDEEGPQGPDAMGGDPGMGGAPMGGPDAMGGAPMGAPNAMGGAPQGGDPGMEGAPMGGPDAMGGAPQDGDPGMGGQGGVEGFQPQVGNDPNAMGGIPQDGGNPEVGEDDEVIDVDELVDTQDETKARVNHLDAKIEKLIKMIDKFETDIDANNQHIEDLKQEFEKRNPTQVEKMTLRAQKGYPFTENPDDYWEKKEEEGDYSPESDNNGIDDQRYQITKNDVDNITDWASIYKSINDGTFHQDLKDILNF